MTVPPKRPRANASSKARTNPAVPSLDLLAGEVGETLIERIALRVAELLAETPPAPSLVDATAVARDLSVERDWVYEHARELGAIRLGGPQGRLRFDLVWIRQRLREEAEGRPRGRAEDPPGLGPRRQAPRPGKSRSAEIGALARSGRARRRPERRARQDPQGGGR